MEHQNTLLIGERGDENALVLDGKGRGHILPFKTEHLWQEVALNRRWQMGGGRDWGGGVAIFTYLLDGKGSGRNGNNTNTLAGRSKSMNELENDANMVEEKTEREGYRK